MQIPYICSEITILIIFQQMSKTARILKLQTEIRGRNYPKKYYPVLLLKGKWLQDCGFKEQQHVNIDVRKEKLIITSLKK